MHIDDIKRGLRAEIKKRENEQYATFQCNVRQMCKDVLAKLEEQESEIAELKSDIADLRDDKKTTDSILDERNAEIAELYSELEAKGQAFANLKEDALNTDKAREGRLQLARKQSMEIRHHKYKRCLAMARWCKAMCGHYLSYEEPKWFWYRKWSNRWLELAEKFKEAK